jgi:hypothetical protein
METIGEHRMPRDEMVKRSGMFKFVEAVDMSRAHYSAEFGYQEGETQ